MASAPRTDPTAASPKTGLAPYVEELRGFFRSREVEFGSAADLSPFVQRLETETGFREDVGSILRTAIYRERDGLSPAELMELLATAVGGNEIDNGAAPEVREAVRKLMGFVESVFRTRWNPGAPTGAAAAPAAPAQTETAPREGPNSHATTDLFYRAQLVANGGAAEGFAAERTPAGNEPVEEDRHRAERGAVEELARPKKEAEPEWRVPFEGLDAGEPERGSRVWLWIAAACALLLAFSAGLVVHQRMVVPLRDANQPYEPAPPPEGTPSSPAQPTAAGAVPLTTTVPSATAVDSDWRARAKTKAPATAAPAEVPHKPGTNVLVDSGEKGLEPRYMAPAVIGASPALMAGRLVYAPPPEYPKLAKMTHIQGIVTVQAVVGKSGHVVRAQAISGHRLLRGAAVREVYGRRYRPYVLDDRPRNVATIVTVEFRLK